MVAFVRPFASYCIALVVSACMLAAACTRDAAPAARPSIASAGAQACLPQVRDGWIRLVPGGDMPMDAGYATIANPCDTPVVVTGATSQAYADVSLHESTIENDMSRMRPVPALEVPVHGSVALQPGHLHVMLMAPRARPKVGDRIVIHLQLQGGRGVDGEFAVRSATP